MDQRRTGVTPGLYVAGLTSTGKTLHAFPQRPEPQLAICGSGPLHLTAGEPFDVSTARSCTRCSRLVLGLLLPGDTVTLPEP